MKPGDLPLMMFLSGLGGSMGAVFVAILFDQARIAALNARGFWSPPFFVDWLPGVVVGGFFLALVGIALMDS